MTDFEKVTNFENLYKAYLRAKRGKGYRNSSAAFSVDALAKIHTIKRLLETKQYAISEYNNFYVFEPKKRLISSGAFVDKVVQHSLCDNVLLPKLEEVFIRNNFAGQKGKGTLFGIKTLREQMGEYYEQNGSKGYILKADVTKFFYSIDHDRLKEILSNHISDQDILWLCNVIIDSTSNPGLPLGNQTSQAFGLLYLSSIDHLVTEKIGIKLYGRYMDDFYVIHQNKDYLKICLDEIKKEIDFLKLSLNNKTQIMPLKQGIKFLGFHTYIHNGQVISRVINDNKRNAMKKYNKMLKKVAEGSLSELDFQKSYNSYVEHLSHGDCERLIYKLSEKYAREV